MNTLFQKITYRFKFSTINELFYRLSRSLYYLVTDWSLFLHLYNYSSRFLINNFFGYSIATRIFDYFYELRSIQYISLLVEKDYSDYSRFYSIFNTEQLLLMTYEERKELLSVFEENDKYHFGFMKFIRNTNEIYDNHIFVSLFFEIRDLIIPVITDTINEYNRLNIGEGTYTNSIVNIHPKDVVIDAGANFGVFSFFAESKGALSYAFEPIDATNKILKSNINLNSSAVFPIKIALGNFVGEIKMNFDSENLGGSSIYFDSKDSNGDNNIVSVNITSLDSFVRVNALSKVDFIKADIEGYERELLIGAINTIREFEPRISICSYHRFDDPVVLTKLIKDINPNYKIIYLSKKIYAYVE